MRYWNAMRQPIGFLLVLAAFDCGAAGAPFAVRLVTTLSSPQPVGTPVGLAPRLENVAKGMIVVRYEFSFNGGPFHIVRDFSQRRDFAWAPPLYEHSETIRVTVRNNETKETAAVETPFQIAPRVKGATPMVVATAHPLIALFSSPPCAEGSEFRVAFRPALDSDAKEDRTPAQACRGSISNNVLVAGMRADTEYRLRQEVVSGGSEKDGDWLPFRTGILDGDFSPVSVAVPRAGGSMPTEPVAVFSSASASAGRRPFATDLEGRMIWYLRSGDFMTRILPGGRFLVLADGQNTVNAILRNQLLRELDLAGNIIRETNTGRVAEQLESRGIHSDCKKGGKECVSGFHHDAIALPNGHFMVVAGLERMMPAGTQGSKEPVDILGDLVIELDEDFQVVGMWNNFDHLDVNRASRYDSKCKEGAGAGGCASVFLAAEANGWTHSNAVNYIASSGDFLVSMPDQNWVIKVDYKNGKGSGKILWRLGDGGDFKVKSNDPHPWFSYQHDAGFDPPGAHTLTLLDNGHVRFNRDKTSQTRGQKWLLDEQNLTATLVYNAKLQVYSSAVGAAQSLKNGGYSFDAGFVDNDISPYSRMVETDADHKVVFALDVYGINIYRSFRVENLYSAPAKTPVN
jgi:arylsulfate sulfotransferase